MRQPVLHVCPGIGHAVTRSQDVSWNLEPVWTSGNRRGRTLVQGHDQPFLTMGLSGAPGCFHNGKSRASTSTGS
ncbi:hypothetical protein P3T27_004289 [Kitasatospora sp. MAA19]|nr:hypothetical protein [Kitasatospora sp. MAA19]